MEAEKRYCKCHMFMFLSSLFLWVHYVHNRMHYMNNTVLQDGWLMQNSLSEMWTLKGSMTHLQALQISVKFCPQVTCDIRRILRKF